MPSSDLKEYRPPQRFLLALLWSVITLGLCFLSLGLGFLVLGENASSDLIVINVYTFLPALVALAFLRYLHTGGLTIQPFRYPGFHYVAFGAYYTVVVLALTIAVGFLAGELSPNPNYTPIPEGTLTGVPILDIAFYLPLFGFIALFSPGGFIRVLGEEYGWRGYLLPQLVKGRPWVPVMASVWLVGLVWFLYHVPFFTIFAPVEDPVELAFLLVGSAGVFFGANMAMCWAYLKTKNLWPALSLHYIWNLTSPLFTGNVYSKSLGWLNPSFDNLWLVNGEGLIGGTFHLLVGLVFLYLIWRDKDELLKHYTSFELIEETSATYGEKKEQVKTDRQSQYPRRKGKRR